MYYRIDDCDGNEICNGLGELDWESVAASVAARRNEPVYVSQEGEGADFEWEEVVGP